jgi:hypothetical protein
MILTSEAAPWEIEGVVEVLEAWEATIEQVRQFLIGSTMSQLASRLFI